MTDFFRFPHIPHLTWLGSGEARTDKVLTSSEANELLGGEVVLEEKIDGANLGFSLNAAGELRLQNRGQYLDAPFIGQFERLTSWLAIHGDGIADVLLEHADEGVMLFGEWCAAKHSLRYTRLPDWFLLFDVIEARGARYWSSARRNALATRLGLFATPELDRGRFTAEQIIASLDKRRSLYRDGPLEGLVIRRESKDWCEQRAKLVRADFTQAISGHWRSRRIEWNRLATISGTKSRQNAQH